MKKDTYEYPKSSFLGMSKDTALIMSKILSNKNILKLLYYTTNDKDKMEDLNSNQVKSLISNR